ncbi:LOW QUALITY PROTEIN: hypothetical protein ACHAW6_016155 [Cyclotella cf. meneghiniana]
MNSIQANSEATKHMASSSMYMMDTIFTDQTGKFPHHSKSGHHYIMVMVEIDFSAILVEAVRNRSDS